MSFRIVDYPHFVDESQYHQALKGMADRLIKMEAVKTVYQVGGISSPGISDLDIVVVFKDNQKIEQNVLSSLSKEEKYLFIHNLYGISEENFTEAELFAFYHSYRLLCGEDVRRSIQVKDEELSTLKIQIALEFMVKLHATLYIQNKYGVLRIRDLLLHVKALKYDLDFLGITSGSLFEKVLQVIDWRKNWFEKCPSKREIIEWWNVFFPEFEKSFEQLLFSHSFFLPKQPTYRIAKNISIIPSAGEIRSINKGIILPPVIFMPPKKYFRLQNRLNEFQFILPIKSEGIPAIVEAKFKFEKKIIGYNKENLPYFLPLTSSLHALT